MASPEPECTCGQSEKAVVWPNGDSAASARSFSAGKVTRRGRFANRQEQDIIAGQAKLSFFSRYLRIHSDGLRRRFRGGASSDRV